MTHKEIVLGIFEISIYSFMLIHHQTDNPVPEMLSRHCGLHLPLDHPSLLPVEADPLASAWSSSIPHLSHVALLATPLQTLKRVNTYLVKADRPEPFP